MIRKIKTVVKKYFIKEKNICYDITLVYVQKKWMQLWKNRGLKKLRFQKSFEKSYLQTYRNFEKTFKNIDKYKNNHFL